MIKFDFFNTNGIANTSEIFLWRRLLPSQAAIAIFSHCAFGIYKAVFCLISLPIWSMHFLVRFYIYGTHSFSGVKATVRLRTLSPRAASVFVFMSIY